MKVGELIKQLSKFDNECEVEVGYADIAVGLDVIYIEPDDKGYTSSFILIDKEMEQFIKDNYEN